MRIAIVKKATGLVSNVIEAPADWKVEAGYDAVPSETAGPGDTWDGTVFTTPVAPERPPSARKRYTTAKTDAERLAVIAGHLGLVNRASSNNEG